MPKKKEEASKLREVTTEEYKEEDKEKTPMSGAVEKTEAIHGLVGVGPKLQEKLQSCGYNTLFDLATARADELKEQVGISFIEAKSIVQQAQDKVMSKMKLKKAEESDKDTKSSKVFIETGSSNLNTLLGGGISTGAVTGLTGRFASGKTQICCEAIVYVLGKLRRKAVFIETEPDTFHLDRLKEIAKEKGYKDIDWNSLFVCEANQIPTMKAQYMQYKLVQSALQNNEDIILVVVDSFNAKIRGDWSRTELLPYRTRELGEHFNLIEMLAAKYNIAWLLTCQAIAPPRPDQGLAAAVKFGDQYYPVGGDYLLHSVNNWIGLTQMKTDVWKATLFDSSYLPRGTAEFTITKRGLIDGVR